MKLTESPTFCPSLWTMLNIDQAGHTSPCFSSSKMLGNIKDNTIQEILAGPVRKEMYQNMAAGKWSEGCGWCKRLEETTGESARTHMGVSPETLELIDADPENFFTLNHFVINWSNLCNLACTYCNPETSTAWQSVKKIPINHVKNEHQDIIELVKTQGHNIQGLSLGGGEPLLQKGLVDFLDYLDSEKVSVLVTTNLSIDITTNPVYQKLKNWKNVNWMISFDNANKEKFEYVRHGASWEMFKQNITQMQADSQRVEAHPAYSVYSALDIMEYYDFCAERKLSLFWCELNHPEVLDIRRAPKLLLELAIAEIDKVVEKYKTHPVNMAVDTLERYKKTLMDNSYLRHISNPANIVAWHKQVEKELGKTNSFTELWPTLADHYK